MVAFSSEFILLRPVAARGSTLLYDVNNRGSIAILGQIDGRGPGRVQLDGDFEPGRIYELIHEARNPKVAGAGLEGIRDLLAYFRDQPVGCAVLCRAFENTCALAELRLHDGLRLADACLAASFRSLVGRGYPAADRSCRYLF